MINPCLRHLNKPYFAPDYEMSRSAVYKWQARSPSPKSSSAEETLNTRKRSIKDIDEDNDDDDDDSNDDGFSSSFSAKPTHAAPTTRKRKRCIPLSADEVSAVYALVELTTADESSHVRRRATL